MSHGSLVHRIMRNQLNHQLSSIQLIMNLKDPHTLRNITALACAIIIATLVSVHGYVQNEYKPASKSIDADKFAEFVIDEMPDSPLRSNLLTVFGAEFAGSSQELNQILQAYSKMKIQELSKDKSL